MAPPPLAATDVIALAVNLKMATVIQILLKATFKLIVYLHRAPGYVVGVLLRGAVEVLPSLVAEGEYARLGRRSAALQRS